MRIEWKGEVEFDLKALTLAQLHSLLSDITGELIVRAQMMEQALTRISDELDGGESNREEICRSAQYTLRRVKA